VVTGSGEPRLMFLAAPGFSIVLDRMPADTRARIGQERRSIIAVGRPGHVRPLYCGTGPAWSGSAPSSATGSTRSPPTTAMTAVPATGPARAAAGWPSWTCRRRRGRSLRTAWR